MEENNRIYSIDIMRGLTLFLLLFFNDLNIRDLPSWLGSISADLGDMGLANWVFPGFLFIAGMVIPYSIDKRISDGQNTKAIARHIIIRTISLLIIGLLMLNADRVNSEFTVIEKNLWSILMLTGIFLIWNNYRENDHNFFTIAGLRLAGIAILVALVYIFRSGEYTNNGSLITGWWGFAGLIGWGYLIASFIYLFTQNNLLNTSLALLFFLVLNILSKLDLLSSLNSLKPFFGVLTEGTVPMIVLSGVITTLIFKKNSENKSDKAIVTIVTIGVISIIAGIVFHRWAIQLQTEAIQSWWLICNGISMILFISLYWIIDIKKYFRWTLFIKSAGKYSLTTCLAAYFIYHIIWITGIPVLFYKQSDSVPLILAGSVIWAMLMMGIIKVLLSLNIKLKL